MGTLGWIIMASVFVLAGVVAYVYSSLSSSYEAKYSLDKPNPEFDEPEGIVLIPRRLILVMWAMIAGLLGLFVYRPEHVLIALLLCGFALVLASIRIHSRSKPTSRRDVGFAFVAALPRLAQAVLYVAVGLHLEGSSFVGGEWVIGLLVAGALACFLLTGSRIRMLGCVRVLSVLSLIALGLFVWPVRYACVDLDRSDALEVAEAYGEPEDRGYSEDKLYARLIRALLRDGGTKPDISYSLVPRANEELNRLDQRSLPAAERERLADQAAEDALAGRGLFLLDDMAEQIELLERLGHPEKGESFRERAPEVLTRWTPDRLDEQCDAVRVMERFGVPSEFDLIALHDDLESQAHGPLIGLPEIEEALAYMTLASTERFPEWEPIAESRSGLLYQIWRWRVALTALLVAITSVGITLRTPNSRALFDPTALGTAPLTKSDHPIG